MVQCLDMKCRGANALTEAKVWSVAQVENLDSVCSTHSGRYVQTSLFLVTQITSTGGPSLRKAREVGIFLEMPG